ncbi:MAG: hypothetical protein JST82_02810 [Bacteroidetes bacterium]|nr:hypothetical protein [Bacteroidota bacterium]
MFQNALYKSVVIACLILSSFYSIAQPTLPDITGATDKGINVISWNCQYDGIKSIAVQRSSDSVHNYVTVGYVKNLKKGPQAFLDGHPAPGKNWYRLYIVFGSDLTWTSNRFKLFVDSATIMNARVMPPNDSLQKLASSIKVDTVSTEIVAGTAAPSQMTTSAPPKITLGIPEAEDVDGYSYVKSQYVFTNPFTGHVNVVIPEWNVYSFSLSFFNDKGRKILEVSRVMAPEIIIDKRNFQKKGIYKFELRKNRKSMETGYITIY